MYNDFHSRDGAPDVQPFKTLQEHQTRLENKLNGLEQASQLDSSALQADLDAVKCEVCGDSPVGDEAPVEMRSHLVIHRWEPGTSDELDQWDRNLAGKSLLPGLDPFDWPGAQEIAAAQQQLPAAAKARMTTKETSEPGVSLFVNGDGKIVLPAGESPLKTRIFAVAHQGRHGHLPHDISTKLIKRYFHWSDLASGCKEWVLRCLHCRVEDAASRVDVEDGVF